MGVWVQLSRMNARSSPSLSSLPRGSLAYCPSQLAPISSRCSWGVEAGPAAPSPGLIATKVAPQVLSVSGRVSGGEEYAWGGIRRHEGVHVP